MTFVPFDLEQWQGVWENRVRFNLAESGVHPLSLSELLEITGTAPEALAEVRLGYSQTNGTEALRAAIAALYPGATARNIMVTVGGAEANFAATWQLLEPGAPAAVMLPNYMQIPGLLESFGGRNELGRPARSLSWSTPTWASARAGPIPIR